ncbi:1,6-anhydro-N-acetylmuramyl-L-alanine amidase AmpD [Pseudoalteromonas ruthenica]|uniref:1,6-anhydro-N-acetylmuramyl-L-alanine amidase AmpD n=1 Tax=Pseudoalteromonas ruthenica TaxID=151081 RepID=A0A5S3ZB47_9GAMM|nr:1,6-anhydro-N-acetylmuramyl-L-alanine amidase AmpD [Pseudoalteromonas ruthenica]TMP88917.1 1,6-anhydro-N-acetylmuramyl-L-alanine amidase AmpD [Pseudoalteromonas ruthenica]
MDIDDLGVCKQAQQLPCSHYDERPQSEVSLLVIHCISLPEGQYSTPYIDDLFAGQIDCQAHPSFSSLAGVSVSAHCLIDRDGKLRQYVPFTQRAWHAGVSQFEGRQRCNDFSIGIELEGTDKSTYTQAQYLTLAQLTKSLLRTYPHLNRQRIVGHSDIAPGRKTDPGEGFDWEHFFDLTFAQDCDKLKST